MPRTTSATYSGSRTPGRLPVGWVFGVFVASLATVVCIIIATAWVVGGRAVPSTSTVQELLPPEPPQQPNGTADDAVAVSALQPPAGADEEHLVGETAAILPGSSQITPVKELPVEQLDQLKSLGWAVPYLSRSDFEHDYAETSSGDSVRTIQVHMTDGEDFINVAETRPEAEDVELHPLQDKLHSVVDLDAVTAQPLELGTGHESTLYHSEGAESWTSAVETSNAQYVVTSSLPTSSAHEITTWVVITDRSRVQLSYSAPGPADRLERGFDEMRSWFGAE